MKNNNDDDYENMMMIINHVNIIIIKKKKINMHKEHTVTTLLINKTSDNSKACSTHWSHHTPSHSSQLLRERVQVRQEARTERLVVREHRTVVHGGSGPGRMLHIVVPAHRLVIDVVLVIAAVLGRGDALVRPLLLVVELSFAQILRKKELLFIPLLSSVALWVLVILWEKCL